MLEAPKQGKTLWILVYDNDGLGHKLKPFYGVSKADVERQIAEWIEQTSNKVNFISLRAYPHGFTLQYSELPGEI